MTIPKVAFGTRFIFAAPKEKPGNKRNIISQAANLLEQALKPEHHENFLIHVASPDTRDVEVLLRLHEPATSSSGDFQAEIDWPDETDLIPGPKTFSLRKPADVEAFFRSLNSFFARHLQKSPLTPRPFIETPFKSSKPKEHTAPTRPTEKGNGKSSTSEEYGSHLFQDASTGDQNTFRASSKRNTQKTKPSSKAPGWRAPKF